MISLENELSSILVMLRRHINPLQSPAYRLPSELLPLVATHFERDADLVCAARTSHHWRNTLQSHPSLWSHLDFQNPGRALLFLKRSKSAPLHVALAGGSRISPLIEPLRPHTTRIVTLELFDCAPQRELLSQSMPSLRRLEIIGDPHRPGELPVGEAATLSLPSVTSLAFHNIYPIPLHAPRLTHFKFRCSVPDSAAMVDRLLDFLYDCPLLESLEVSHVEGFVRPRNRAIPLPNLRSYKQGLLKDGVYTPRILDVLSLPPSCSVTLISRFRSYARAENVSFLPRLENPQYLAGVRRVKLSAVAHTSKYTICGVLELINDEGARVRLEREQPRIGGAMDGRFSLAYFNRSKVLDVRSVEILCVEGYELLGGDAPTADSVGEALGCFGNIKTLILSRAAVEPYLKLLALEANAGVANEVQRFPHVQTLIIHSIAWTDSSGSDILQALLSAARRRKAAGNPFKSVSVFLLPVPNPGDREVEEWEELRGCIEEFKLVTGDDILDWDIDRYFLGGLEHLRSHENVEWNLYYDAWYLYA